MTAEPSTDALSSQAGASFARLVEIMARLRAPGGCPWDAEQTHESLAMHLLEEAHETMDAIDRGDSDGLAEELGDVLLQVVFHAEIAQETGRFDVVKVIDDLIAKLIARHPHVFGDKEVSGAAEVLANWEALKAEHKKRGALDDDLPGSLPALLLAHKAVRRLRGAGRPFEVSADTLVASARRYTEDPDAEAFGDLVLQAVALAEGRGIDPEGAVRRRSRRAMAETDEV